MEGVVISFWRSQKAQVPTSGHRCDATGLIRKVAHLSLVERLDHTSGHMVHRPDVCVVTMTVGNPNIHESSSVLGEACSTSQKVSCWEHKKCLLPIRRRPLNIKTKLMSEIRLVA